MSADPHPVNFNCGCFVRFAVIDKSERQMLSCCPLHERSSLAQTFLRRAAIRKRQHMTTYGGDDVDYAVAVSLEECATDAASLPSSSFTAEEVARVKSALLCADGVRIPLTDRVLQTLQQATLGEPQEKK